MTKSFLSHFFNWRIHFCYDKMYKIIFHWTKMIFVVTDFNFVNRIHFCVTKVTFVRQNSLLSCHRSYSLLFYVNHSPIGCNTRIFGEGKPRISRDQLGSLINDRSMPCTGRLVGHIRFCIQNWLLCGQKWVLYNKNEFLLSSADKNYFCHDKNQFCRQNSLLYTKFTFVHKNPFCHDKVHFYQQNSLLYTKVKFCQEYSHFCWQKSVVLTKVTFVMTKAISFCKSHFCRYKSSFCWQNSLWKMKSLGCVQNSILYQNIRMQTISILDKQ